MGQAKIISIEYGYSRQKKVLAGIFCAAGAIGIGCGIAAGSFGGVGEASRQGASESPESQTGGRAFANAVPAGFTTNAWAKALSDTEALAGKEKKEEQDRMDAEERDERRAGILKVQRQYQVFMERSPTRYEQYEFLRPKMTTFLFSNNKGIKEVLEFRQHYRELAREALNEQVIKARQGKQDPYIFRVSGYDVGCYDDEDNSTYCTQTFEFLARELDEYIDRPHPQQNTSGQEAPESLLVVYGHVIPQP
jgi:hypothetical protein